MTKLYPSCSPPRRRAGAAVKYVGGPLARGAKTPCYSDHAQAPGRDRGDQTPQEVERLEVELGLEVEVVLGWGSGERDGGPTGGAKRL